MGLIIELFSAGVLIWIIILVILAVIAYAKLPSPHRPRKAPKRAVGKPYAKRRGSDVREDNSD